MVEQPQLRRDGKRVCGRRRKVCAINTGGCGYRFTAADHESWVCPRCARSRRCTQVPVRGSSACKFHGGASPRGIASHSFKDGSSMRHSALSRYPRLKQLFALYSRDAGLREHLDDMALLSAKIDALLEGMVGDGVYQTITSRLTDFERVMRDSPYDDRKRDYALNALHEAVHDGNDEAARWREVYRLLEQLGRMRERQDKHEAAMKAVIPLVDVFEFLGELTGALHRHIHDPRLLEALQRDLDRLLLPPAEQTVH